MIAPTNYENQNKTTRHTKTREYVKNARSRLHSEEQTPTLERCQRTESGWQAKASRRARAELYMRIRSCCIFHCIRVIIHKYFMEVSQEGTKDAKHRTSCCRYRCPLIFFEETMSLNKVGYKITETTNMSQVLIE